MQSVFDGGEFVGTAHPGGEECHVTWPRITNADKEQIHSMTVFKFPMDGVPPYYSDPGLVSHPQH